MKKILVLIVLVVIAAIAAFQFGDGLRRPRFDIGNDKETLFFADGGSTLSALLYVAYEKTFFFTQKVNFHLSFYPSGRQALAALVDGKADLATVADVPIVNSVLDGKEFFILATIGSSRTGVAILAVGEIKTPQDLKGRKIGYSPGTNSEYFLHEFLIRNGISRSDVVTVPVLPDKLDEALGSGKIQAVSAFDPALTSLKDVFGNRAHLFYAPDVYTFTWNVVASRRLLNYPVALESVIRALHVAEEYAKENPEEGIKITSRYLKMSEGQVQNIWSSMELEVNLLQGLVINLERQAEWAGKLRNSTEMPDFSRIIYTPAIKAVIPGKVTVIE